MRDYGKGHTLYIAMLMGTIWDSSATRYEWDSTHSGLSFPRLLRAFLRYAGVKPNSIAHIPYPRVQAKVRVELPLMDDKGNVLVGLTSLNDRPVDPFELEVELPRQARKFRKVFVVTEGSRKLREVEALVEGSRLHLTVPSFDTHAMILALKDSCPLISVELEGVKRGSVNLPEIRPGQEFMAKATVYNLSRSSLPAGKLSVSLPKGWFLSDLEKKIPRIKPADHQTAEFSIKAPEFNDRKRLRPVVFKYEAGKTRSTPAVELVWWLPPKDI